jgi:hypothetical protein
MATDGLRRWSANNRLLALLQLQARAQQRPRTARSRTKYVDRTVQPAEGKQSWDSTASRRRPPTPARHERNG